MRPIDVAVRITPGVVSGTGDGYFLFKQFVVRFEVLISDGPVYTNAIFGIDTKI
jgi:hypothetical protein